MSLVLFVMMIFIHDKYFKQYDYYTKYVEVVESYLARKNGEWKNFLDKGEDFIKGNSAFLQDLDILGECSLFQDLSVCKTLGGRERLFSKLSNLEIEKSDLLESQEAIVELANDGDFSIRFQIAMQYYEKKKIHLEHNFSYLEKEIGNHKWDFVVGVVVGSICILFLLLGCFHIISFSYFYGMFLFNLFLSYLYSFIFKEEFQCLDQVIASYGKLRDVFSCVVEEKFQANLLKKIKKRMDKGLKQIVKLNKLDGMNSLKNNFLSNFLLNGIGCFNLFLLYVFSEFLNQSMVSLKESVADVSELEALVSLATLGVVRKECCVPELMESVKIEFSSIKHPL